MAAFEQAMHSCAVASHAVPVPNARVVASTSLHGRIDPGTALVWLEQDSASGRRRAGCRPRAPGGAWSPLVRPPATVRAPCNVPFL